MINNILESNLFKWNLISNSVSQISTSFLMSISYWCQNNIKVKNKIKMVSVSIECQHQQAYTTLLSTIHSYSISLLSKTDNLFLLLLNVDPNIDRTLV